MKTLTTLALTVALTGTALSVQAAGQAERDLAQCMAQLRGIYGEETELNLVDRRRNQHGTRMRVAAKLDADNAYFANCWVARYHEGDYGYGENSTALAAVDLGPDSQ